MGFTADEWIAAAIGAVAAVIVVYIAVVLYVVVFG